ncbi:MAG TPA: ATP-binding cassette domain-containing protein, partial [Stellaceae bacterium]|nr:ATP-binding cassette domain-containing protein [Stellaceae bacterium]
MTASSEVRLIELTKTFGPTVAVDAISAEIPGGKYCCLLGPSGCGKTTTLRMIAGHEAPTSGDIIVGGARVTDLPPARRRTAMMFQSYALFPHLNCIDNVAFSLRMRGVSKVERRAKASEMLRLVEMETQAERLPSQLSGGQQQRVALARALVTNFASARHFSAAGCGRAIGRRGKQVRTRLSAGGRWIRTSGTADDARLLADPYRTTRRDRCRKKG